MGRSPVCPWKNALAADRNLQLQIRYSGDILRASKVVEKDPAGYHLVETPHGRWWIPEGNDYVLPYNLAEQAREVYGTGEYAVRSGDIVLDCGANVGDWTRVALDHGAKLVVGFEPGPENLEAFRRNFKDEIAAGRVVVVAKGVWDKDDILLLKRDPHNSAADSFIMLDDGTPGVKAALTTIDEAVAELKLERVDYIKMDIEGAEARALSRRARYNCKFPPAAVHCRRAPAWRRSADPPGSEELVAGLPLHLRSLPGNQGRTYPGRRALFPVNVLYFQ